MSAWEKSQEPQQKFIQTLEAVHHEFEQTFQELLERTDANTVLHGIGFTIAARAFTTSDPVRALNEFRLMLDKCYKAVKKSKEAGEWKPRLGD